MVRVDPFQLLFCHVVLSATCQGFVPSTTNVKSRNDGSNGHQVSSALNSGLPDSSGGGNVGFQTTENPGAQAGAVPQEDPSQTASYSNYQQKSMSFEEFCKSGIPENNPIPPTQPQQQDPYSYYGTVYPGTQQQQTQQPQQSTSSFQTAPQVVGTVDIETNEEDLFFADPNMFFINDSENANDMVVSPEPIDNTQENLIPHSTLPVQDEPQDESKDIDIEDRYLQMVSNEVSVKQLIGANPYAITDVPVDVMVDRGLDLIEDNFQKKNGKLRGQAKLKGKKEPKKDRPTVVVLGTGWAAHAFIKCASTYDLRIVVVSPVNHFVSLHSKPLQICSFQYSTHLTR